LPLIVKSFGHFNSGVISNVFSIAFANASDDAIGNSVVMDMSNFGCKIIENQIPPFGEIHFLPALPFPPVCVAAITTEPLFSGSSAIFYACS
jgi:hypothetical protein